MVKDNYVICNSNTKLVIQALLKFPVKFVDGNYYSEGAEIPGNFDIIVKQMIIKKILKNELSHFLYDRHINSKISEGARSDNWSLVEPLVSSKLSSIMLCLWMLLKVRIAFKIKGIHGVLKTIAAKKPLIVQEFDQREFESLINDLNNACLYFPVKTKCLEWAVTFILLAFQRGLKCNLVIGVQTMPFLAHAWVETNGTAFSDSYEISQDVVKILDTPFS